MVSHIWSGAATDYLKILDKFPRKIGNTTDPDLAPRLQLYFSSFVERNELAIAILFRHWKFFHEFTFAILVLKNFFFVSSVSMSCF